MPKATPHIFVSHAHEDNAWCRAFVEALRHGGADVWYDEHNLGYGELAEEIERELASRPIFIVVLSPASVAKPWVRRETEAAIHLRDTVPGRGILPVVAARAEVPLLWAGYKRIAGPDGGGLDPAEAAGRVAHSLAQGSAVAAGANPYPVDYARVFGGAVPPPSGARAAGWPDSSRLSRRQLLLGMGVIGVVGVAAADIFAMRGGRGGDSPQSTKGHASPTSTSTTNAAPPGQTLYVYGGHAGPVYALAWSPDNRRILSGGVDQTVRLWSPSGGFDERVYSFTARPGVPAVVRDIAWGRHVNRVAMCAEDGLVALYDVANGAVLKSIQPPSVNPYVRGVSWSPDNAQVALVGNTNGGVPRIEIWDANLTEVLQSWEGHTGQVTSVEWSPDGRYLVTTSDDFTAKVWDPRNGGLVAQFTGHTDRVYRASWSRDSTLVVTGSNDGTAQVWAAQSGQRVRELVKSTSAVYPVAWSPDGKYVAAGGVDATIRVWATDTWRAMSPFYGHSGYVDVIAWAADSTRMASGSDDTTVRIWQVQ